MDLQEILKPVPIPKKRTPRKKVINEESEKARKNRVDGEVLHLIALRGEMELEFAKITKKKE